jgi:hypothetical protein
MVDRRIGFKYRIILENMNDPIMKLMIEVPDLLHRQGWDAGWPETPRPTYTVLPAIVSSGHLKSLAYLSAC